jgi:hypothetical protein
MTYTTAAQIRSFLAVPKAEESELKALEYIDTRFQTFDNLNSLERFIEEAQRSNDELQAKVSIFKMIKGLTHTNLSRVRIALPE